MPRTGSCCISPPVARSPTCKRTSTARLPATARPVGPPADLPGGFLFGEAATTLPKNAVVDAAVSASSHRQVLGSEGGWCAPVTAIGPLNLRACHASRLSFWKTTDIRRRGRLDADPSHPPQKGDYFVDPLDDGKCSRKAMVRSGHARAGWRSSRLLSVLPCLLYGRPKPMI